MASFKMPIDPSGTPSGFFDFLDPSQEVPLPDEPGVRSGRSPNLDFIVSFEADSDSSFEVLGEEVPIEEARKDVPAPPVVKPSVLVAPSALKRAPSMPTIIEEDEGEEEDGDLTVTPNAAQRALLPPDRFARPHSSSQVACAAAVPENAGDDSLDTPRPRGELFSLFSPGGQFVLLIRRTTTPQPKRVPSLYPLRTHSMPVPPSTLVSRASKSPKAIHFVNLTFTSRRLRTATSQTSASTPRSMSISPLGTKLCSESSLRKNQRLRRPLRSGNWSLEKRLRWGRVWMWVQTLTRICNCSSPV